MAKRPTERPCRMCGRVQTRAINGHCTACHYYSITAKRPVSDLFGLVGGRWVLHPGGVYKWVTNDSHKHGKKVCQFCKDVRGGAVDAHPHVSTTPRAVESSFPMSVSVETMNAGNDQKRVDPRRTVLEHRRGPRQSKGTTDS